MSEITFFWFRRDLRLEDNHGLYQALTQSSRVQPVFIFDTEILDRLTDRDDARVSFIHDALSDLQRELRRHGAELWVRHGKPLEVWKQLVSEHSPQAVYTNEDYEPQALRRDQAVEKFLATRKIPFYRFKDQCLFHKDEILNGSGKPYTVYTPYKKKVLTHLQASPLPDFSVEKKIAALHRPRERAELPSLKEIGFTRSARTFPSKKFPTSTVKSYDQTRDFPADEKGTSHLGLHLRFGTVSVRAMARQAQKLNATWLSELIWRDFFMQVLWHAPQVVDQSFRPQYDQIAWRHSKSDFRRWCEGETGFPLVDAGMRQLRATGTMHNRVRMVTASFLTKHLLIYWLEGEREFARWLLDYDLAANNGNWQWAAGTGCDAAPYFRVFNPMAQAKRFDPDGLYIQKWVPEWGTSKYPKPMVDHDEARGRALAAYSRALKGSSK